MTTETDGIVWRPTPEVAARSRIAGFMRAHAIASLEELQRRSVATARAALPGRPGSPAVA